MALQDFLVLMDETRGTAGRLKTAATFAMKQGAHLKALNLSLQQEIPGYIAAELSTEVLSLRDERAKAEAKTGQDAFEAACAAAG
ncbi:MAG: hypothetical protein AAFY02_03630, partial [Pseudomonadota bacterium]